MLDLHLDHHFASFSEFNGVAGEIDKHLAHASRIAAYALRDGRIHMADQLQPLLARSMSEHVHHALDHGDKLEIDGFQFDLAGFDFREVQDIVQERKQGIGALQHRLELFSLLIVQIRAER